MSEETGDLREQERVTSSTVDLSGKGLAATEESHEPLASSRTLRWYVAVLLCFPPLLIAGTLLWMSTPEYQRHAQYPSFIGIGYGSRLRGADCEVLVDGDSSALVGVLPKVIEAKTGLKTCNIAEVAGVKAINGFMELDDYLAHNRPPRLLIFVFVPENLTNPERWREVATFEGWFYRLRMHRDPGLLRLMMHDPDDVITAAELGLRTGVQWLPKHPLPPELVELRERSGGELPEPGEALSECKPPVKVRAPDPQWVEAVRRRYSSAATRVLVDVTPEPICDPSLAFYRAHLGDVTDNQLETLPLSEYTDTGRLHTNAVGAQHISERIAQQIQASMNARTLDGRAETTQSGGR